MPSEKPLNAALAEVLTEATLRRLAYGKSYYRGVSYFEHGAVESLSEFSGKLSARVRGADLYRVMLWPEEGLSYSCTCPVGTDGLFCKHCVAAGLEWLARQSENEPLDEPGEQAEPDEVTLEEVRQYLGRQSTDALVGMMMRQAEVDPEFAELLANRAICSRPGGPGVPFLRKAITNATRVHEGAYGYALASLADRVRAALEPVWALVEAGRASEALALAEHALNRLDKAAREVHDPDDECVSELLSEAQDLHLEACRKLKPDPVKLARKLFNAARNSDSGILQDAAQTYAELLGERGIVEYRRLIEAEWQRLPVLKPQHEEWRRQEPDRQKIMNMMESMARASGDIDELARVMALDLSSAGRYLEVARVYQEAGNPDKALRWAEKGAKAFPHQTDSRLREFLFDEYLRRGRQNDAMSVAWAEFTEFPCKSHYDGLKQRAERIGQWPTWREEAIEYLRERAARDRKPRREKPPDWGWGLDQNTTALVEILMAEGDQDGAWREAAGAELQADLWMTLAEARAKKHPADAIPVYQHYVEYLMSGRLGNRYEEAVRCLLQFAKLAARAGQYPQFERYLAEFRSNYKRKWSLMMLLDSTPWPRPVSVPER